MINFKPRPHLKLRKVTRLSRILSNSVVRFAVSGVVAIITTVLLFIFMNYLIGSFGEYAESATEEYFTLDTVIIRQDSENTESRVQRPVPVPEYPDLREYKDVIINMEDDDSTESDTGEYKAGSE